MSPANDVQLFKSGGGGRLLGVRESNQALAELKTKLEFALSRLNDQDTQRTGIEEIQEFLQTLYPDWFPMVISCIGEAGTNLKPLGRCESVKLLGLLAELHGEAVVPLLGRMLQVVVMRLQDADLHLREACAETVFRLARALVLDVENSVVFATLLKPLFGALGEHSKWVQIGAAQCICSVIQGSPQPVVRDNLGRLCSRLVQHLSLPLAMAKPQLLTACIYAMDAVKGADFDEVLPSLMPCLESCLNASSDWQTRKQAIEVLQTIGDNPELGQSLDLAPTQNNSTPGPTPLQRRVAMLLEVVRTDKVRAVREAVKDVMLRWSITKAPNSVGSSFASATRSSSPTSAAAWSAEAREALQRGDRPGAPARWTGDAKEALQRGDRPVPARSSSPNLAAYRQHMADTERESLKTPGDGGQTSPTGGSAGVRQNRSVRASTREREEEHAGGEGGVASNERADAASEKARAIKAALSGAALNSTKKPRPKRERQSIFDGPANKNFFNMGAVGTPAQNAPAVPGGGAGGEEMGEDMDHGPDVTPEAFESSRVSDMQVLQEEVEIAREMRESMIRAKRASPRRELNNAGGSDARESGGTFGREADMADAWADDAGSPDVTAWTQEETSRIMADAASGEYALPVEPDGAEPLTYSDDEADARVAGPTIHSNAIDHASPPTTDGTASVSLSGSGVSNAGAARRAGPSGRHRIDHGGSSNSRSSAFNVHKEPAPEKKRADISNGEISFQQLVSRLNALEEEKHESEERLLALERTCAGQSEALADQSRQLELAERRLQLQEQQCRQQEQRSQQQEQQLLQQEKRLHEQELQIQQQEQQFEDQSLLLREHEQQLEQQELLLEQHKAYINDFLAPSTSGHSRHVGSRTELQATRPAAPDVTSRAIVDSRNSASGTSSMSALVTEIPPPLADMASPVVNAEPQRAVSASSLREGLSQVPFDAGNNIAAVPKNSQVKKASGLLWDKILELCEDQRYLEAYKQVIAEPEETCLLRLMQHTGPIVERLDAESNSRLIRRLIHILSSPSKEPASSCIEQVFSWLWQALDVGIHFTSSQVEDLAAALQKASAPQSFRERAEAAQLLSRVSALRRS